ncbi:MAG: type II toxin-antitoxin system MqsA family antitoxin [Magnetococcales bacterium]|nr:type II toxin-antitoxin system MqsA family antitoxin [Magnetococcales bacterium]NGZ06068.1 type II toxin-antitoxin system MqsA family antitoxin [Magnetococcales bacterium]
MKCTLCKHGETRHGMVSVTLERQGTTVVFRQVPALVCDNCGEIYHDASVSIQLLRRAEDAAAAGVEVDIRRYAAA